VTTQNITDPSLGPRLLDLLAAGRSAAQAVEEVVANAPHVAYRQLTAIDGQGGTAAYSGPNTLGRHTSAEGENCVAAGNLLADALVPAAMVAAFEQDSARPLAERLLAGLRAGLDAGGEEGPVHSAGLLVVDEVSWPTTDLRVDWHEDPIGELERVWAVWMPQEADYVTRAVDPRLAPGYGVPGER
jgi:uncharacterized Ntn-hydrolase superfamily protein